uniref:Uncharacterized protein n=1 Tax=Panagrolaimus sp. ES5 TaxID=591445 RepID=A0AC34GCK5_9BILA
MDDEEILQAKNRLWHGEGQTELLNDMPYQFKEIMIIIEKIDAKTVIKYEDIYDLLQHIIDDEPKASLEVPKVLQSNHESPPPPLGSKPLQPPQDAQLPLPPAVSKLPRPLLIPEPPANTSTVIEPNRLPAPLPQAIIAPENDQYRFFETGKRNGKTGIGIIKDGRKLHKKGNSPDNGGRWKFDCRKCYGLKIYISAATLANAQPGDIVPIEEEVGFHTCD